MENITLIKIITDGDFTPTKSYRVARGKHSFVLTCVRSIPFGYYFSTEKNINDIKDFFNNGPIAATLSTDEGTLKTNELIMSPLSFTGTRPANQDDIHVATIKHQLAEMICDYKEDIILNEPAGEIAINS